MRLILKYSFYFTSLFGLGGQFLVIPYDAKELGLGSHNKIGGFSSLLLYSAKEILHLILAKKIGGVSLSSCRL